MRLVSPVPTGAPASAATGLPAPSCAGPSARARLRRAWVLLASLLLLVCCPAAALTEELEYGWKLKGFGGRVIGLFFPHSGEALLRTDSGPGDSSVTTLELTSPHREGEFYRYGSEIGTRGRPVRVWSAYQFRGKSKSREREVDEEDVLDFASAIHAIRRERPVEERKFRLWSDDREYPLKVTPGGEEVIDGAGRSWTTQRYVIEGRRVEGEKFWKGRFQLWIADDEPATPVRIIGEKGMLTVRLELAEVSRDGEVYRAADQEAEEGDDGADLPLAESLAPN